MESILSSLYSTLVPGVSKQWPITLTKNIQVYEECRVPWSIVNAIIVRSRDKITARYKYLREAVIRYESIPTATYSTTDGIHFMCSRQKEDYSVPVGEQIRIETACTIRELPCYLKDDMTRWVAYINIFYPFVKYMSSVLYRDVLQYIGNVQTNTEARLSITEWY